MLKPEWSVEIEGMPPIGFESLRGLHFWFAGGQVRRPPPEILFETLPVRGRFAVFLDGECAFGVWAWVTRLAAPAPAEPAAAADAAPADDAAALVQQI